MSEFLDNANKWLIKAIIKLNPFILKDWVHEDVSKAVARVREMNPKIHVAPFVIDVAKYLSYLESSNIDYQAVYSGSHYEKSLEDYLSVELMGGISRDDVVMDVASQGSHFPDYLRKKVGCIVYNQDLCYEPGVRVFEVGYNAAHLPFPDNYFTKMTLHCSFEHFEEDDDSRFIVEAGRVLKKGGKLCILPLYFLENYYISTDPLLTMWKRKKFDEGARVVYKIGWGSEFGRLYDPSNLTTRVINHARNVFDITLYVIQNGRDIDKSCYIKIALVLTKNEQPK